MVASVRTMSLGMTEFDRMAHDLAQSDFDAVERDGYRAAWAAEGSRVEVIELETGETVTYDADDLVRAASDREVENARAGAEHPDT